MSEAEYVRLANIINDRFDRVEKRLSSVEAGQAKIFSYTTAAGYFWKIILGLAGLVLVASAVAGAIVQVTR